MRKHIGLAAAFSVAIVALAFTLAGCSKGGGGGGSLSISDNPATDFTYDMTKDGKGIVIKSYTGKSPKVGIPAKIEDMPVTEIGYGAVSNNNIVTEVNIPDSVVKIGEVAFYNLSHLTKVHLPKSLKTLNRGTFSGDTNLKEIVITNSVETVGFGIFAGCVNLTKANLPKSLKTIKGNAFNGCTNLTTLTIPAELTSVTFDNDMFTGSFIGCGRLHIKTRQRLKALGYKGEF
jgi:hypothetical protein